MIIKKTNLFFSISFFFLVFLVFFLIHFSVLSFNQVQLTSSFIFPSYIFNFVISILVLIVITKLGKSKSFYLGFVFMFLSGVKLLIFLLIFYPVFNYDNKIDIIEKTSFLVPYFLGLILEIASVIPQLKKM